MVEIQYLKQVLDVINYIEENLENDISPTDITKITSYSYFHFHRIFEMVVGETISSYQRTRRLAKAAEKLLVNKIRIVDIAFSLQFESHEAFSRAFKKQYHVTPSAYRKNGVPMLIGQKFSLTESSVIGRSRLLHKPDIVMIKPLTLSGLYFPMSITNNESEKNWLLFESEIAKNETHLIEAPRYEIFETHAECEPTSLNEQSTTTAFIGVTDRRFNRMRPSIAPRKRHQAG